MDKLPTLKPNLQDTGHREIEADTKRKRDTRIRKKQRVSRYVQFVSVTSDSDVHGVNIQDRKRTKNFVTGATCQADPNLLSDSDHDVSKRATFPDASMHRQSGSIVGQIGENVVNLHGGKNIALKPLRYVPDCQLNVRHSNGLRYALYTGYSLVVPVDKVSQVVQASSLLSVRSLGEDPSVKDVAASNHVGFRFGQSLRNKQHSDHYGLGGLQRSLTFTNGYRYRNGRPELQSMKRTFLNGKNILSERMSSGRQTNAKMLVPVYDHLVSYKTPTSKSALKPLEPQRKIKTLSPSKHGYHPRSQSPTFKCLVAASERLQMVRMADEIERPIKPSSPDDTAIKDFDKNNVGSRRNPSLANIDDFQCFLLPTQFDARPNQQQGSLSDKKPIGINMFNFEPLYSDGQRIYKNTAPQSNATSAKSEETVDSELSKKDSLVTANDCNTENTEQENLKCASRNSPKFPIETFIKNGPTTHIHLFLPNILPGTRELTDLDASRHSSQDDQPEQQTTDHVGSKGADSQLMSKRQLANTPPMPDRVTHKLREASSPDLMPSRKLTKDKAAGKTSKEEMSHLKQHNKKKLKAVKRRVSICTHSEKSEHSSGRKTNSTTSSAHSEHQLQSEKLKKQLDDFPTLISLNYS